MENKLKKYEDRKKSLEPWLIAIIVMGSFIAFCGFMALVIWLLNKKPKHNDNEYNVILQSECSENSDCHGNSKCLQQKCWDLDDPKQNKLYKFLVEDMDRYK